MSDDFEHLPGCAGQQNMAQPRSQRLIGPMCTCRKDLREIEEFKAYINTPEIQFQLRKIEK